MADRSAGARRTVLCLVALAWCVVGCAPPPAPGPALGPIERVSLDADGRQIPTGALVSAMSSDGRWILFQAGGDLVAGPDELNESNAYLRDRTTGEVVWVHDPSVDPSGQDVTRVHLLNRTATRAVVEGDGLDGSGRRGVFLFDVPSSTFQYMGPMPNLLFGFSSQMSDISADGRFVVGTDGFVAESLRTFDAQSGTWTDVFTQALEPGRVSVVQAPKFVGDTTRVVFGVDNAGPTLWTVEADGTSLEQIAADLGPAPVYSARPLAAGATCVLLFIQGATYYDQRLVDLGTGQGRPVGRRSYVRTGSGVRTAFNDFRAVDVADNCRDVLGESYVWGRPVLVDVQLGTMSEAFPMLYDPGMSLRPLQISDDAATLVVSTSKPLVADDTNEQVDVFARRRD